jgi:hypothetical protein
MKSKRFSEEQIIGVLKEAEAGANGPDGFDSGFRALIRLPGWEAFGGSKRPRRPLG